MARTRRPGLKIGHRLDIRPTPKEIQIFMSHVYIGSVSPYSEATGVKTECWEYEGRHDGNGYPEVHFRRLGDKMAGHRVAFIIFNGYIEQGEDIDHECHNPGCVNPDHLIARKRKGKDGNAADGARWRWRVEREKAAAAVEKKERHNHSRPRPPRRPALALDEVPF